MLKETYTMCQDKRRAAIKEFEPHRRRHDEIMILTAQTIKKMVENFRGYVNNQIDERHTCTCCRPRFYDDGWATEKGITLRMDADHPHDIVDTSWTWEQVEELMFGEGML